MKDTGKKARMASVLEYKRGPGDVVDNGLKTPWGNPAMPDQTYMDQRPRDFASMNAAFKSKNPEFKDGASLGDWTSWQFDPAV